MMCDYKQLLKDYPKNMNLDQMRIVCHISKKTARGLLHDGIVPYVSTGKKTHSYQIKKSAVIKYLVQRDNASEKHRFGGNANSDNAKPTPNAGSNTDMGKNSATPYKVPQCKEYPDVLSAKQAAALAGVTPSVVNTWARSKQLKAFSRGNAWFVPKLALVEYLQESRN